MKVQKSSLKQLETILRELCHAPGCKRLEKCPNQCPCRRERKFKLNTETAICWEIADKIKDFIRWDVRTKLESHALESAVFAYSDLTRFHMSRGWQKFFEKVGHFVYRINQVNKVECLDYFKRAGYLLNRYPRD